MHGEIEIQYAYDNHHDYEHLFYPIGNSPILISNINLETINLKP